MATIYRALVTALLLLWAYVLFTGLAAGTDSDALAWHLKVGLAGTLFAGAVQSLPFAYFLGTHFWVKAFARASRAGGEWEQRHREWMKGRSYVWMYLAPFATMFAAIAGGLVETGRVPHWVHPGLLVVALGAQLMALVVVPASMRRNSALMDELADLHRVPRPDTPEMEELLAEEEAVALPPAFQLSRLLLLFSAQSLLVWAYLHWGTEGFRGVPLWPFAVASCVLLTVGLAFNAHFDPVDPKTPTASWLRGLGAGLLAALVFAIVL